MAGKGKDKALKKQKQARLPSSELILRVFRGGGVAAKKIRRTTFGRSMAAECDARLVEALQNQVQNIGLLRIDLELLLDSYTSDSIQCVLERLCAEGFLIYYWRRREGVKYIASDVYYVLRSVFFSPALTTTCATTSKQE